jgi:hypothetical protein
MDYACQQRQATGSDVAGAFGGGLPLGKLRLGCFRLPGGILSDAEITLSAQTGGRQRIEHQAHVSGRHKRRRGRACWRMLGDDVRRLYLSPALRTVLASDQASYLTTTSGSDAIYSSNAIVARDGPRIGGQIPATSH